MYKQLTYLQTQRLNRQPQKGNILPSVAQYLKKQKTPEKKNQQKEAPTYRIRSNEKLIIQNNQYRKASSQSPKTEKITSKRFCSFHSSKIQNHENNNKPIKEKQNISRRQQTEITLQNCSPTKQNLMESQELMLKIQLQNGNRRVKTEECERDSGREMNSIREHFQYKKKIISGEKLLDLLLLSTIELKHHFEKTNTARQNYLPKAKVARLSIKQFPKDFFQ